MLWKMSPWKPELSFDVSIARRLVRFGGWVALSGLLGWFYVWADSLIVGIYLGPRELGLYRVGNTFVGMIFGFMFGPMLPVLYSHLSKIQHNQELVKATLFKVIKVITFLSVPMAFLIVVNSSFIANVVFGGKWQGVELVISVLALTHGYANIVSANGEAYRALGSPSYDAKIMSFALGFYSTAYFVSIQHGFVAFLWTRFFTMLLGLAIQLWVAKIVTNLSTNMTLRYAFKISTICLIVLVVAKLIQFNSMFLFDNTLLKEAIILIFSSILLIFILWLTERNDLISTILALAKKEKFNPI
jgi:O-antigen/teichoic acid export membrane protein